jgi:hypothetical protein
MFDLSSATRANTKREKLMKNSNIVDLSDTVPTTSDKAAEEFFAHLNSKLMPRMRRWALALEMIECGWWPTYPEYAVYDSALEVVLDIRDDCMNSLWMELQQLSKAKREKELDRMAQNPVLRQWLTLYRKNIARAEEHKRKWAERKAAQS